MPERTKITDLTRPMDPDMAAYADGDYRDPDFVIRTWCTVESRGYWVSKLELGTQTGTHIDAPAHFKAGAATLEALPVDKLVGDYFLVNLDALGSGTPPSDLVDGFEQQSILFLKSCSRDTSLTPRQMDALISLAATVWVVAGVVDIPDEPPLSFHRRLADAGIFLVEDLDARAASTVEDGGRIIALPLRLSGVGGSPCRVLLLT